MYEKQIQELQAKETAEDYVEELMNKSTESVERQEKKDKTPPVVGIQLPIEEVMVVD